ncbi:cbb3-type cytochrome oxidase assembly protein CcoS [Amaricoccus sp.]|uniref:cbb3-type cytochrome oxidase assembly protein CcoS n=1 Tax=Amaricoccus sp. TaxID=1872485 RepID=UPI0026304466|nr:cbb3-type cytochrome oxidase assembly protein CcoS [Amaricoccus sp.]HRO12106.1 cbb3-type cytochrome oxidase assembly protein CcoS [Amaricoccus sp.]
MSLLLPLSIAMGLAGLAAFLWALRSGQFEDPDGSAWRVITPQDPPSTKGRPHVGQLAPEPEDQDARRGL